MQGTGSAWSPFYRQASAPSQGQFPMRGAFDPERTTQELIFHHGDPPLRLRAPLLHGRKLGLLEASQ
jgi:hypothetical protein